jgi:hypothetical protein
MTFGNGCGPQRFEVANEGNDIGDRGSHSKAAWPQIPLDPLKGVDSSSPLHTHVRQPSNGCLRSTMQISIFVVPSFLPWRYEPQVQEHARLVVDLFGLFDRITKRFCVFPNPNIPCHDSNERRRFPEQLHCCKMKRIERANRFDGKRPAHADEDRIGHSNQVTATLTHSASVLKRYTSCSSAGHGPEEVHARELVISGAGRARRRARGRRRSIARRRRSLRCAQPRRGSWPDRRRTFRRGSRCSRRRSVRPARRHD